MPTITYPKYGRRLQSKLDEYFETVGDWAATRTTPAEDTTNVKFYETDKKSVAITSDGTSTNCYMEKTLSSPVDVRNCNIEVTIHITDAELAKCSATFLNIYLYDSTYKSAIIAPTKTSLPRKKGDGWYSYVFNANYMSVSGGATDIDVPLSALKYIRIYFLHPSGQTPTITFDCIRFIEQPTGFYVNLTFDDCKTNDLIMARYLHSKGIKGSFALNGNKVGTAGYLSLAEVKQIKAMGHLITNHSYNHQGMSGLSFDDLFDEIIDNAEYMIDNDLEEGAYIWYIPAGSAEWLGWAEDPDLILPYVDYIRCSGNMLNAGCACHQYYGGKIVDYVYSFDIPATVTTLLSDANVLKSRSFLTLGFHPYEAAIVDGNGDITANMIAMIDRLVALKNSQTIEIITPIDALNQTRQSASSGLFRPSRRF